LALLKSLQICCITKETKTLSAPDTHFVHEHMNFFFWGGGYNFCVFVEVQSVNQNERFYLTAWNANKPSAARRPLSSFVVVKKCKFFG
jgi:hypothetical protein